MLRLHGLGADTPEVLGSIRPRVVTGVRNFLPRGGSLPYDQWERRQRVVILILWCHAVGLTIFGAVRGKGLLHSAAEGAIVAVAAVLAGQKELGRNRQSVIAALGLVAASGIFVHLSGGVIEVHFHFFIMLAVIALYQQWTPFLLSILYVLIHHGVMGALDPHSVFNHPVYASYAGKTLLDVLELGGGPPNNVARDIVAALLNAHAGYTPSLSVGAVKGIWSEFITTGSFSPTSGVHWSADDIIAYLHTTMPS